MSPPATGAVATTAAPRSSSARRATSGWRVIGAAPAGRAAASAVDQRVGTCARPSPAPPRSRRPHRSTGRARRHPVSDRVEVAEQPHPVVGRRPGGRRRRGCLASIASTRSCVVEPGRRRTAGRGAGVGVVPGRGQGGGGAPVHRAADVPAAGAGAGHLDPVGEPGVRRAARRARRRPSASGRCCPGRPARCGSDPAVRGGGQRRPSSAGRAEDARRRPRSTIVITIAPPTAVQKPSTWKPRSSWPASQLVSSSISALITSRNRPERQDDERERQDLTTGFTNDVTTPRISATTSSGTSLCLSSACPWCGPVK